MSLLKLNREQENRIVQKTHTIKLLLVDIMPLEDKRNLPKSFTVALDNINKQIEKCKEYCQPEYIQPAW